jgi:hypothetical protein
LTRPLRLGEFGTVQYYWMDSSQFRNPRTEAAAANLRSVVGFWAAAMHEMGLSQDADQHVHYVLAVCYALVGRCKSLQDVYHDAYLAPNSVSIDTSSLPDDVRRRIQDVVYSRDRSHVQQELDATLGRFDPPAKVLPLLQEAFRRWVGKGVSLLRRHGNAGLTQFLQEVEYWLAKFRKKGGQPWLRHFLYLFGYECKAAFYTCYANAWIGLIPWLREHRALDPLSERFLRFWHNQSQPVEIPHGQTSEGILYPTRRGAIAVEKEPTGVSVPQAVCFDTDPIGPTHVRDVFSGQVLSLHPLSGFFMKDPALCAIAGHFFATDAYERALRYGQAHLCSAYWNLIGAILTAAHFYRQALDRQPERRGVHQRENADHLARTRPEDDSESTLLEDFALARKIRCARCGGELRLRTYHAAEPGATIFPADYACHACGHPVTITIAWTDLETWLRSGD